MSFLGSDAPAVAGHGATMAGVGGFLLMSSVTPIAIHEAVVHRWPDRVGDCLREAA